VRLGRRVSPQAELVGWMAAAAAVEVPAVMHAAIVCCTHGNTPATQAAGAALADVAATLVAAVNRVVARSLLSRCPRT
jgi:hypothetical protein